MKNAFVGSGTPILLAASTRRLFRFLLAVWLSLSAVPSFAATQSIEIGEFTSDGTIALQLPKFQEQFADGTTVVEIAVTEYNGNRVVKRKGYSASGDCRTEIAPIMNSNGQIIPSTFVAPVGTRVFFATLIPVTVLSCSDDGCHALKNIPIDQPPALSAKCDQTELSNNICRCHINRGSGDELTNGDFCNSWRVSIFLQVRNWILSRYIQ